MKNNNSQWVYNGRHGAAKNNRKKSVKGQLKTQHKEICEKTIKTQLKGICKRTNKNTTSLNLSEDNEKHNSNKSVITQSQ